MRLSKALKDCQFPSDPEEFRETVLRMFETLFAGETDEEILYHPSTKAVILCNAVRSHYHHDFPEDLILRTLVNTRKASRR